MCCLAQKRLTFLWPDQTCSAGLAVPPHFPALLRDSLPSVSSSPGDQGGSRAGEGSRGLLGAAGRTHDQEGGAWAGGRSGAKDPAFSCGNPVPLALLFCLSPSPTTSGNHTPQGGGPDQGHVHSNSCPVTLWPLLWKPNLFPSGHNVTGSLGFLIYPHSAPRVPPTSLLLPLS